MTLRLCICLIWLLPSVALAEEIAFTFDDGLDPRTQPAAAQWNQALLDALAEHRVRALYLPAAGRVNSRRGMALVREWGRRGHIVGNHSYSHLNFGSEEISVARFIADIARADRILRRVEGWQALFRFPYLKEGATAKRRDAVRDWLDAHGYRVAPVSIDASDWYYSKRLLEWREAQPDGDLHPFRDAYLQHLWDRAQYYDSLSRATLGRSAPHLILLHTNAINALFLSDVIRMFRSRGWTIIDPQQALADPLFSMRPTPLPAGESLLWALARQNGMPGLRYPGEDGVYEEALLDAVEAQIASPGQ